MGKSNKTDLYKVRENIKNISTHTVLIILCFIMVFPFLWMIIASFKPNIEIMSVQFKLFSSSWILDNYKKVISETPVVRAYFNSILVASIVTVSTIFTSSLAGFLFAKFRFRGRDLLFFLVLGSIMLPSEIILIPLYFMISKFNLINSYPGLVFPFLISPFSVFLMRQFILGLPTELIEAAKVDGASDWRIYFKIILPLVKPMIAVVGILTFLWTFDAFLWPFVIITKSDMMTLPIILGRYSQSQAGVIAGPSMAMTTITIVPLLIVYIFFQRFFVRGISMTGIKG